MAYVLLRDDSLNISAAFGTRAAALAAIRRAVESHGRAAVRGVALAHSPRGGGLRIIAEDDALAEQYRRVPTSQVAGSLMTYAETHAPEAVGAVEAEIDAFYAARPEGGSIHPDVVLALLRKTLPPSAVRRIEQVLAQQELR